MADINFRLDDKVAMITGAGRGIGKATALACADAGADIVLVSRTGAELDAVAAEVEARGRQALTLVFDIRDLAAQSEGVADALERFGHIDVLVNNAATNVYRPFIEVPEHEYDTIVDTNLKALFFLSQSICRHMIESGRGGKVVNIVSAMALVGGEMRAVYCATKGGVLQLTKVMAIELAEHNIQVNCIAPTFIRTELSAKAFEDEAFYSDIIRRIPAHHVGDVDDVAGAVVYLASPAAGFVTGHCLSVDGGYVAW